METKNRYWTFILYPKFYGKKVKKSWWDETINFLNDLHLPVAISPLHDQDKNPTGETKKAHYHVIVCFEGPTTYKNVKDNICDPLQAPIPKRVLSLRGMYRYLTHLDNPEKFQYNKEDITLLGDFNLDMTDTEINLLKLEITNFIDQKGFTSYSDLVDYYKDNGLYDEFRIISSRESVYFFKTYIDNKKRH